MLYKNIICLLLLPLITIVGFISLISITPGLTESRDGSKGSLVDYWFDSIVLLKVKILKIDNNHDSIMERFKMI